MNVDIHMSLETLAAVLILVLYGIGDALSKRQRIRWQNKQRTEFTCVAFIYLITTVVACSITIVGKVGPWSMVWLLMLMSLEYVLFGYPVERKPSAKKPSQGI